MLRYKITALSNDVARIAERQASFSHMRELEFVADHWRDIGFIVMIDDMETGRVWEYEPA